MTRSGADYAWFENDFPDIGEAYCFTLVRGLPPAEVISRREGRPAPPLQGIAEVGDAAFAQYDLEDGARQLIGMTTLGVWTLLIEPNGYLGVTEEPVLPASAGASWVSHFVDVNAVGTFLWAEDEVLRPCFHPCSRRTAGAPRPTYSSTSWSGSASILRRRLRTRLSSPAAFALAEHLTGVAITPALLQDTTFSCTTVEIR
ncbi:DUF6461 domain-containing protein [Streptomyces sp. NPDC023588]|uniref:DUF6461 domain-containing protein n=1 Tax=Streptomyces sp. NPDC023588 TaxID=3154907 RepID=UPI0033DB4243